ncbi:hypothetical protein AOLI_G00008000 [Acnodon oligacanthus]
MSHAVTEAMIESYALMILVMSTFFVYFCGMVWAFCNPKLSGIEDEDTPECESDAAKTSEGAVEQFFRSAGETQRTRDCREGRTADLPWAQTRGSAVLQQGQRSGNINCEQSCILR